MFCIPILVVVKKFAGIFILLSGICASISYGSDHKNYFYRSCLRFLVLSACASCISLFTFFFFPENMIYFGILHFLALCRIISILFIRFRFINVILSATIFSYAFFIKKICSLNYIFLIVGFIPQWFDSFDYFPLVPWFSVYLLGIALGNILYKNGKRQFYITENCPDKFIFKVFIFIGKKSLPIYIVHQPIVVGILLIYLSL